MGVIKMKYIIPILILFLIHSVYAETTFFDQDDAFVMSNSQTTPTGEVIGETTGGGGCRYEWNCTNWIECLQSGKQTRNCINIGTCSDTYKFPEIEQNCSYVTPEFEEKGKELKNKTEKEDGIEEIIPDNGTEEIPDKEIVNKNKVFIYFVIALIILIIIIYLKKDYLKKLIKRTR